MKTHCPECNTEYDKPYPDDFVCRDCLFKLSVSELITDKSIPIVIIEEKKQ